MMNRSLVLTLIVLSVLPVGCSGLSIQISANPPNASQPGNASSTPTPTPLSSTPPSVLPVGAAVSNPANAPAIELANTQTATASTPTSLDDEVRKHWIGFYRFSESLPPSPSPMVMEYQIRIYEVGDLVLADIDINGFQTMERLQANIVPINGNPEEIGLYFKDVREDNKLASYSPADLLMKLQFVRNGAQTLRVTFAGIRPLVPQHRDGWQTDYSFR